MLILNVLIFNTTGTLFICSHSHCKINVLFYNNMVLKFKNKFENYIIK